MGNNTHWLRKGAGFIVGMATLAAGMIVPMTAQAADTQPLIHYSFDAAQTGASIKNEGTAADSDATLTGTASTANGVISLTGSQTIEVPTAAITGKKDLTVSIWLKNNTGGADVSAAYIGAAKTGNYPSNGYFLLNPQNKSGYVKSVMTTATAAAPSNSPWGTEVGPGATNAATTGTKATADMALYTTVIDGTDGTMSFYLNGQPVGDATYAIPAGGLTNYGDLKAYIGKSSYSDPNSKIDVDDYAIYDSALAAADVTALYDAQALDKAAASVAAVVPATATEDFTLPTTAAGATVAWKSDNAAIAVDAATGKATVTRPAADTADATVTLTATLTVGTATKDVTYTVTVPKQLSDDEKAQADLDAITIESSDDVRSNISLPTLGSVNGSAISWAVTDGADTATVEAKGVNDKSTTLTVKRPAAGAEAKTVTLKATVKSGAVTKENTYTLTVQPMPAADQKDEAYVWAFFTGEGVGGEKISLAASKGNNALDWNTLNNGTPLFTSEFGEKGLRDPFIMKSKDGDKFYMLATDLKISGRPNANGISSLNGFAGAQVNGSRYIEIWKSDDLVTWSPQSHVEVSDADAGNTWAPEAYWDAEIGKYVVYWASNLYDTDNTADRKAMTYNRMMYVTTDDFVNFSKPTVWIDSKRGNGTDGKGSIDATVQKVGDTYYRVYKDEASMSLRQEKSTDLLATVKGDYPGATGAADQWTQVATNIGAGQANGYGKTFTSGEGPSLFKANDGDVNGYQYYLFADQPNYHNGPNHYVPMATEDIASGKWTVIGDKMPESNFPTNSDGGKPRHGTVLPVTRAQYQKVLEKYAPAIAVKSVDALSASTEAGTAPTLPAKAHLTHTDGSEADVDVKWDEVPADAYAKAGTFTVKGVAQDDSRMPVEATVTVTSTEPAPSADASLKSLSVAGAEVSLDEAASADGASLEVADPAAVTDADVAAPASDKDASVKVAVADGVVTVTVTAADGTTTKTYTVKLVKKAEPAPSKTLRFTDVVSSTPHADDIQWLGESGISTGWKTGETDTEITAVFSPMGPVVRQDMAAFLYRLAGSPAYEPTEADKARFVDVTDATPHAKEIWWLASTGIASGYRNADGTFSFGPMRTVVRQDMAAFLKHLADVKGAKPSLGEGKAFLDVNAGTPHYEEIAWLAQTGVTTGFEDNTFGGMRTVVRQDMAAFLHRMSTNVLASTK